MEVEASLAQGREHVAEGLLALAVSSDAVDQLAALEDLHRVLHPLEVNRVVREVEEGLAIVESVIKELAQ